MRTPISRREFLRGASWLTAGLWGTGASLAADAAAGEDRSLLSRASPAGQPVPPGPPLASPFAGLKREYDVVVVGSGYGGSISALRLAQPGRTLCVLERGREWRAGEFPNSAVEALKGVRSELNPLGLHDFRFYQEMDVLVGAGLGGTSLINANVVIPADSEVFDQSPWPDEIRRARDSGELARLYARVRAMLAVEAFPNGTPPVRKITAQENACRALHTPFTRLDVAVNFTRYDGTANAEGVPQNLCHLCGNCVTGCNFSAKNTLTANYLPAAKRAGAELYVQMEVRNLNKLPSGIWELEFYRYPDQTNGTGVAGKLRARTVILAGGVLGSTELLLRSRKRGLRFSSLLGERFSGNGDYLGLSYNGDQRTDVLGFGSETGKAAQMRVGPTILTAARSPENVPLAQRLTIEDGAFPSSMVAICRDGFNLEALPHSFHQAVRAARDWFGYHPSGALNHTMIYLGMAHDEAAGRLSLDHLGRISLAWKNPANQPALHALAAEMKLHAKFHRGHYMNPDPRSGAIGGHHLITVHPLGGCPMAEDAGHGVVDHLGRVFDADGGPGAIHAGLHVLDGSIVPTALGVNPLLTISALTERAMERMVN